MKKRRAFLKWAGGKYSLVEDIRKYLPQANTLVEPFVGAGSVFLNTDFDTYYLADVNPDLINLYNGLKEHPQRYIEDAKTLFTAENNNKNVYLDVRAEFNLSKDKYQRSLYFLYLNRFGFNGLCRYNKRGGFNVPFGSYTKPYFPQAELEFFAEKAQKATFVCQGYEQSFLQAPQDSVIYCDPPYAPLSTGSSFTNYAIGGFTLDDQASLGNHARQIVQERRIPVLISNHDTVWTREIYHGALLNTVKVKRTISRNANGRNKVDELLALFLPENGARFSE